MRRPSPFPPLPQYIDPHSDIGFAIADHAAGRRATTEYVPFRKQSGQVCAEMKTTNFFSSKHETGKPRMKRKPAHSPAFWRGRCGLVKRAKVLKQPNGRLPGDCRRPIEPHEFR